MPQKLWAVGEEVLAADFQTYVQGQVCPAFTNVAQRDSQWSAPPNGAVCVTVDTGRFWQRIGGVWWQPFSLIAQSIRQTNAGPATAEADIGVQITITPPAGRRIRLEAGLRGINIVAPGIGVMRMREGAIELSSWQYPQVAGGGPGGMVGVTLNPSAATHTYRLTLEGVGGGATTQATATSPTWLEATDLGAV